MTSISNSPLFLFYLVDHIGRSYYINAQGQVSTSGLPAPLGASPDGWEDMSLGWERNLQKFGLVRNFSLTLAFMEDGAGILEWIVNRKNLDERLWLLVQRRELETTDTDFDVVYRIYYKGEVDLSTYRRQRRKVLVNLLEGGRTLDIQTNETVTNEYPLTVDKTIRVYIDGPILRHSGNYAVPDQLQISTADYQFLALPFTLLSNEGISTGLAFVEQFIEAVGNVSTYTASSINYFCTLNGAVSANPVSLHVVGKIRFKVDQNTIGGFFRVFFRTSTGVQTGNFEVVPGVPQVVGGIYEIPIDTVITIHPGEKLFLLGFIGSNVTGAQTMQIEYLTGSLLSATYDNRFRGTYVRLYKAMDLYRAMIEKVCGSADYAQSALLASSSMCFTSGDGLRGLPGAVIKETFQNFFTWWSKVKAAGLGVESGQVVLEPWTHFIRKTGQDVVDLGEVKDMEISYATDVFTNTIKVGSPEQNYDDTNGRYEYNSPQEWGSNMRRVQKVLDLVPTIRSDMYGIEYVRINLDGKTTTDSSSDNDTFVINVDFDNPQQDADGTFYKVKRAVYQGGIQGVPDVAHSYNIEELTPHRQLVEAWGSWLHSVFQGYDGTNLSLTSATKNKSLVTLGGPTGDVAESKAIEISKLPAGLFQNKKLTFTALAPINLYKVLSTAPWTLFVGTWQGWPFAGFLLKGAQKSKTNQEQSFTLLADISTDFKLLENA